MTEAGTEVRSKQSLTTLRVAQGHQRTRTARARFDNTQGKLTAPMGYELQLNHQPRLDVFVVCLLPSIFVR